MMYVDKGLSLYRAKEMNNSKVISIGFYVTGSRSPVDVYLPVRDLTAENLVL